MKTAIRLSVMLAVAVLVCSGCSNKVKYGKFSEEEMANIPLANRYELPEASGGMVYSVFSETITADQVLDPLAKDMAHIADKATQEHFVQLTIKLFRQQIRQLVTDILLYQEASKSAPENIDEILDDAVEKETTRFIASFGNNYAVAEGKIKEMGMDWRSFREHQRRLIMTQSFIANKLTEKKQTTKRELTERYEALKEEVFCQPGTVQFSLIDLVPDKLTAEQTAGFDNAQMAAVALAEEIKNKLLAGADFADLANRYSSGPMAALGGKWRTVTVGSGSLPEIYAPLEMAAYQLENGQVTEPLESNGHVFLLRLDEKVAGGCKSFEEVESMLIQQVAFEFRQEQYQKLVDKLQQRIDVVQMERFAEYCANEAFRQWKSK